MCGQTGLGVERGGRAQAPLLSGGRCTAPPPYCSPPPHQGILVGRTRDVDDHVMWLLQCSRFEEALVTAEAGGIKPETYDQVGGSLG